MMSAHQAVLLCFVAGIGNPSEAIGMSAEAHFRANPIRKVVTMLQDMQKSVEVEGNKEKELYEQFMCACQNQGGSLKAGIQEANGKIDELTAKGESDAAQKSQLEQDVMSHKSDREQAEKTLKESAAMRQKEAEEFAAGSGEMKSNIQAMAGAVAALKKGLSASMLQTGVGQLLRHIISSSPVVNDGMRETLMSFLDSGETENTEGSSDQIIGVVEQMQETMEGDLKESEASEAEALASFASLKDAKSKEVSAAGKAIEEKTARVGTLAVELVQGKADLEATTKARDEDVKFAGNLETTCATRTQEWDERQKVRAEEMQALSETVEMLNGDDALELFKKSGAGSASAMLLQTSASSRSKARRAMRAMRLLRDSLSTRSHSSMIRMMLLALKGKRKSDGGGFGKVVGMIDDMVDLLKKEQVEEDRKKDFCVAEMNKNEDELKQLAGEVGDLEAEISEMSDAVKNIQSEIDGLKQGLADLDKEVTIATQQRKAEHEEFLQTSSTNSAALELIAMAKNRMDKFYNPTAYKKPEEPAAFLQVSARRSAAGSELDSDLTSFGTYKKSGGSGGVMAMMAELTKEVELDLQGGKIEEKNAQADYEEAMGDASTKRSDDSKLLVTKNGEKASLQSKLEDGNEAKATKDEEHQNSANTLMDLHQSCDTLLQNYDSKKEARTKETEGLQQSKAVLSGASGFLQH